MCAATPGTQGAGRDVTRVRFPSPAIVVGVTIMSRFVAPLTFTIAAAWVVVLFVLVHSTP